MKDSFFGGWADWFMNLLAKEEALPVDMPRILLVPDSLGSTTFLAFY